MSVKKKELWKNRENKYQNQYWVYVILRQHSCDEVNKIKTLWILIHFYSHNGIYARVTILFTCDPFETTIFDYIIGTDSMCVCVRASFEERRKKNKMSMLFHVSLGFQSFSRSFSSFSPFICFTFEIDQTKKQKQNAQKVKIISPWYSPYMFRPFQWSSSNENSISSAFQPFLCVPFSIWHFVCSIRFEKRIHCGRDCKKK